MKNYPMPMAYEEKSLTKEFEEGASMEDGVAGKLPMYTEYENTHIKTSLTEVNNTTGDH